MKYYDKVVITNLPSFYKINLYNEINKSCKLLVIYTWDHSQGRNQDFFEGTMQFDYIHLKDSGFTRIIQLKRILRSTEYKELILGGWDSIPLWASAFISSKKKNALVIESSYLESTTKGIKGLIKRIFISRISKVYASGKSQRRITDDLGFKGETIITKGVGIFNYIKQPIFTTRNKVKNFLYVGRLTKVKNLEYLIRRFNKHPELTLTIIGFGELEAHLKSIANENIVFLGAINNSELSTHYQKADVFILPSISEPWGLVIEEALNNGTPVMVSDKVGCSEEIINKNNGVIFSLNPDNFEEQLAKIVDIENYNRMRSDISKMDFEEIEDRQVKCYI
ncbi:MAG: glycosyltransferase family 4 protein [Alistipes sp.]|nr:glycosyltransferase family 4 protein [Alistipes sp.]